jgi:hypothetical protein
MPTSVGKQLKQYNLFYAAHISLLLPVIFINSHICRSIRYVLAQGPGFRRPGFRRPSRPGFRRRPTQL